MELNMFEITGWLAFLLLAMTVLFRYLKTEQESLFEHKQIKISGEGLAPHIEVIMFKVLSNIQSRAAREKRFEIVIALSDDGDGYTASCPRIDGLTARGSTIEYAIYEFGFALHLFTETMIENREVFKWS
jgi:predicted RNase H-like HicB family nuclease/preprotein translocase subunit SecG